MQASCRHLAPFGQGGATVVPEGFAGDAVAFEVEAVMDRGMRSGLACMTGLPEMRGYADAQQKQTRRLIFAMNGSQQRLCDRQRRRLHMAMPSPGPSTAFTGPGRSISVDAAWRHRAGMVSEFFWQDCNGGDKDSFRMVRRMWIQEIINVVVENKNKHTFHERSLWAHDGMNIVVQFVARYRWGALELTSAQYEAVEETSYDADTYDTYYNTGSRFDVLDCEGRLFVDGMDAVEIEFCTAKQASGTHPVPDDSTLQAMSAFTWFEENYGAGKGDVSRLFKALSEKGWTFLGHTYAIDGDIAVMRKAEYDYLWTSEDSSNEATGSVEKNPYAERIDFLNNQEET